MLKRNQSLFYYALYIKKKPVRRTDAEDGAIETGEWKLIYTKPIPAHANISAAKGTAVTQSFGTDVHYDRIIVMERDTPIDERAILWIDTPPKLTRYKTTKTPCDYIVTKVARGLNHTTIAARRVDVSR